jgi:hypothetical protein
VIGAGSLAAAIGEVAACPEDRPPDLLILDLDDQTVSEEEPGLEILTALPTVLLASNPLPSRCSRRPDAAPFLRKPFAMGDLRQRVGTALRGGIAGEQPRP